MMIHSVATHGRRTWAAYTWRPSISKTIFKCTALMERMRRQPWTSPTPGIQGCRSVWRTHGRDPPVTYIMASADCAQDCHHWMDGTMLHIQQAATHAGAIKSTGCAHETYQQMANVACIYDCPMNGISGCRSRVAIVGVPIACKPWMELKSGMLMRNHCSSATHGQHAWMTSMNDIRG